MRNLGLCVCDRIHGCPGSMDARVAGESAHTLFVHTVFSSVHTSAFCKCLLSRVPAVACTAATHVLPSRIAWHTCSGSLLRACMHEHVQRCGVVRLLFYSRQKMKLNRSDIMPDPGGHRPRRPCAQRRTRAKHDQAQASAPGQNRTRSVGGATTHGRRTRQAGKSVPT